VVVVGKRFVALLRLNLDGVREVLAAANGPQTTKMSYLHRCMCASFSMPAMCMCATICAILLTGVMTSVSLFVLSIVLLLLVVALVVLISLLLIGLTRLVRFESLVGLIRGPATRTAQGE
jgi:hypothetical protein